MSYIESAFYGDEKSMRNVTTSLGGKVDGGKIDVPVDEKLIPALEVSESAELDLKDEKDIRAQAVKGCGGEVDRACISTTEARLRQEKLLEKQNAANASAAMIKGRRLTVNIVDESGKRKRLVVPEGQKFKLDGVRSGKAGEGITMETVRNNALIIVGVIIGAFIYAFGVIATYTVFKPQGVFVWGPLTAAAALIPYSGYFFIFGYFMISKAADTYIRLSVPTGTLPPSQPALPSLPSIPKLPSLSGLIPKGINIPRV